MCVNVTVPHIPITSTQKRVFSKIGVSVRKNSVTIKKKLLLTERQGFCETFLGPEAAGARLSSIA